MIHCNQVCMYNFPDDGCLKPKTAICPLSNIARDTNVLTNADHIRSMTDEELAEFLCSVYDEDEDCAKFINGIIIPAYSEQDVEDWLKQPYKEDT